MKPGSGTNPEGGQVAAPRSMRLCLRWFLFALLVTLPGESWAISLYDVIQMSKEGYSDREIIKLIDVTQARFQLDAEAIVSLKEAGVSERVIQALIEVSPPAHRPTQTPPSHRDSRAADTSREPVPPARTSPHCGGGPGELASGKEVFPAAAIERTTSGGSTTTRTRRRSTPKD